jgi:CubicO group peptidase (beta-lactamase class C family)
MRAILKNLRPSLFAALIIWMGLLSSCSKEESSQKEVDVAKVIPTFESYVQKAMQDWQTPGAAVGIIQGNRLVYAKGFGAKEIKTSNPPDAQTLFPIASLSKAFGATVLALLVDQGHLNWEDEIVKHDPSFMLYEPWVTRNFQIIDLFAQHSGLASYALTDLFELGFTPSQILKLLHYVKPVSSFRSHFSYQNALQLELDPLCQAVADETWDAIVKKNILEPLGMQRTFFKLSDFYRHENRASCHLLSHDDQMQVIPLVPFIETTGPSGGMISCVEDLAKWISMQLANGKFQDKQIISESNLKVTRTPQTIIDASTFYALGWVVSHESSYTMIWHNGDIQGGHHFLAFVPEANVGIVILSNLSETQMPEAAALRFFDLIFNRPEKDYSAEYLKKTKKRKEEKKKELEPPQNSSSALPLENYVGKYSNDIYGTFEIATKDGKLALSLPQSEGSSAILSHWSRDIFLVEWQGFLRSIDFSEGSKIIFDQDPAGQMGSFRYYPGDASQDFYYFERLPNKDHSSDAKPEEEQTQA